MHWQLSSLASVDYLDCKLSIQYKWDKAKAERRENFGKLDSKTWKLMLFLFMSGALVQGGGVQKKQQLMNK